MELIAKLVIGAALLVLAARRLRQSAIVAYLALGVVAGPSVLGVLESTEEIGHLAEIGVVFLLYFIGLEFHLSTLRKMAKLATLGALIQIGLTAALVWGGGRIVGFDAREGVILGLATALSSTAIVMKAFEERRQADSMAANAALAVLLGQDLVALLTVAAMPVIAGDTHETKLHLSPAWSLVVMIVALPALFFVARKVLPALFRRAAIAKNQEAFALCSFGGCLLIAALAGRLGASEALGAFLGGLVLADTPFAHQAKADLATIKNLALGFFFVSVGMLVDLRVVWQNIGLLALALPALIVAKALVGAITFRIFRLPTSIALAGGLAISQVGEFAFVLATSANQSGALSGPHTQLLVALSVLTMLVAPWLVSRSLQFGSFAARRFFGAPPEPPPAPASDPETGCVRGTRAVVVGYGPVGRTVCKILIRFGLVPTVIDLDVATVKKLHEIGLGAVYGDAGQRDVLAAAGLVDSRYLVVTLPDLATRSQVVTSARAVNPGVTIISRARYLDERSSLEGLGANHIAYEEAEVAAETARLLLTSLGARTELLNREVAMLRQEIAVRTGFTRIMRRAGNPLSDATTVVARPEPIDPTPPPKA